jgi:hypothetical protein
LGDGGRPPAVTNRQDEGTAEGVEVVDVATLLLSASKA